MENRVELCIYMDVWSCNPFVLLKCTKEITEIAEINLINTPHHNQQDCFMMILSRCFYSSLLSYALFCVQLRTVHIKFTVQFL
jgi:hypothetical protein